MIKCFNNIVERFCVKIELENDDGQEILLFQLDEYETEVYAPIEIDKIDNIMSNLKDFIDGNKDTFRWEMYECDTGELTSTSEYLNNIVIDFKILQIEDKRVVTITLDFKWYDWDFKAMMNNFYHIKFDNLDARNFLQERRYKYITALSEVQIFYDYLESYIYSIKKWQ